MKLGLPEIANVIVAHPIQDATDEEMHRKCDAVYEQIIGSLSPQKATSAAKL